MLKTFSWFGPLLQVLIALDDPAEVTLDTGIAVHGLTSESGNVHSFLGIPFANAPPFSLPQPVVYLEDIDATSYGSACVQHDQLTTATESMLTYIEESGLNIPVPFDQAEECLTINVFKPATATKESKLPVVVWVYGGGFLIGDSETYDAMGKQVVEKSIVASEDVIFVTFNYRLSAYGFLGGAEVQAAGIGNLGLRDQRMALEWVQDYISAFGGNPGRVILWGQSSGSVSATMQLLAYDGNSQVLFHGAFLQSGAAIPVGSILNGQAQFDALISAVGCDGALDELRCLRAVELPQLRPIVDATDAIFSETHPSADGTFLTDNPQRLVRDGKIADVPIVAGNVDDEGTLFSIGKIGSIKSDADFESWINSTWLPDATDGERESVFLNYPQDPTVGSPFATGYLNQYKYNTQYKRVSAFQGDLVFQAPRRFFVQTISNLPNHQSKLWVYLSKRLKLLPTIGSVHGSDLFPDGDGNLNLLSDYLVKFANTLDPNLGVEDTAWPEYTAQDPQMLLFPPGLFEPPLPVAATDDHRAEAFDILNDLGLKYPL
ncbi:hypothetical protein HYPSUDRAFT_204126 [Hypholoma sublateritium FD-334 SS-4]|uniref:Carboxylic ester hydrolase n=1 Tax=Hypholoma sublateritium (strain FD-334 SS-4) TaxID=945553 RepID=A0A0D2NML5_HYPSF|nr:hypothetical protein HYPSUDRAFT_204126 [Hypholoma sublateritium FD-334 SS-4]